MALSEIRIASFSIFSVTTIPPVTFISAVVDISPDPDGSITIFSLLLNPSILPVLVILIESVLISFPATSSMGLDWME